MPFTIIGIRGSNFMGQPQHRDNVRRVDFAAKTSTRPGRTRSNEAEARPRNSESDRDRVRVVSLREHRRRRTRRSMQSLHTLAIVIMAALLGAFIAVVLLDPPL